VLAIGWMMVGAVVHATSTGALRMKAGTYEAKVLGVAHAAARRLSH
jgi:hypothetical protein